MPPKKSVNQKQFNVQQEAEAKRKKALNQMQLNQKQLNQKQLNTIKNGKVVSFEKAKTLIKPAEIPVKVNIPAKPDTLEIKTIVEFAKKIQEGALTGPHGRGMYKEKENVGLKKIDLLANIAEGDAKYCSYTPLKDLKLSLILNLANCAYVIGINSTPMMPLVINVENVSYPTEAAALDSFANFLNKYKKALEDSYEEKKNWDNEDFGEIFFSVLEFLAEKPLGDVKSYLSNIEAKWNELSEKRAKNVESKPKLPEHVVGFIKKHIEANIKIWLAPITTEKNSEQEKTKKVVDSLKDSAFKKDYRGLGADKILIWNILASLCSRKDGAELQHNVKADSDLNNGITNSALYASLCGIIKHAAFYFMECARSKMFEKVLTKYIDMQHQDMNFDWRAPLLELAHSYMQLLSRTEKKEIAIKEYMKQKFGDVNPFSETEEAQHVIDNEALEQRGGPRLYV